MGTPNWTEGIKGQMKRKGCIKGKFSQWLALIPMNRNQFIPVNIQPTVKPNTACQVVPNNNHFRSFVTVHVW